MDVYRLRYTPLLLFILCCLVTHTYAQTDASILEKTVKFSQKNVRLDTVFKVTARQTGIRFSYNSRRLNSSYRLHIATNTLTVRQLLEELKSKTGVLYTLIGNQVVLNIEKSTVQRPLKPEVKPQTIKPEPARGLTPPSQIPDSLKGKTSKPDSIIVHQDSVSRIPFVPSSTSGESPTDSTIVSNAIPSRTITRSQIDSAQNTKAVSVNRKASIKENFFIDLGVSAEETLFIGATLRLGAPKIFGTLSIKSNGKSVILMYGLGTSLRIRGKSRVLLNAQYGSYSKTFSHEQVDADTVLQTYKVGVKNNWIWVGAGMEWNVTSSGSLKFYTGLNFNMLESRYTINGSNSSLEEMTISDPEQKFAAFYPFYTLTNNYQNGQSSSFKTWIGVQVRISYRIFYR